MSNPEKAVLVELKSLPLSEELGLSSVDSDLRLLIQALGAKLRQLLKEPPSKIMQLLYKIDIDERKAKEAFAAETHDEIINRLSELIIQRMIQKAESRLKYRNNAL